MALLLREADVARVIDMDATIEAVEAATRALGTGEAANQPRRRVRPPGGVLNVMFGSLPAAGVTGLKSYTVGGGKVRFLVLVYDLGGAPLAVIEADLLGAYRTGAATAVAVRHLAPEAKSVAIIGSGHQARTQVLALSRVLSLRQLTLYSRNADHRERFAAEVKEELGLPAQAAASAQDAVRDAEVVVTITNSASPVLDGGSLKRTRLVVGAGCNIPTRSELPVDLVGDARGVIVDQLETAQIESGDLLAAAAAGRFDWDSAVELGALLSGSATVDGEGAGPLLFESHGLAIWDLAAAAKLLPEARRAGLGEEVSLFG